ncbi:hypothetical protein EJ08DRAFT_698472 [Tothia fuscella]|uniref:Protein kinase domain-containing protein n=1 Tax=Tothia fuscella TaxID=1048955 RepID=A0A9P4NPL9_9PEZI|nr:hypothetical protein EJ08DRAFT_698472 [Tothia fuscella]
MGCRHGDLKPDNILVFEKKVGPSNSYKHKQDISHFSLADKHQRSLGHLVIADFDTAKIFEHATHAQDRCTNRIRAAARYEPPEASPLHPNQKVHSRSDDVWSLGCVFLEFIIWMRYGSGGLGEFNRELGDSRIERFWRFNERMYVLHPVVTAWVERMGLKYCESCERWTEDDSIYQQHLCRLEVSDCIKSQYLRKLLLVVVEGILVTDNGSRLTPSLLYEAVVSNELTRGWTASLKTSSNHIEGLDIDRRVDLQSTTAGADIWRNPELDDRSQAFFY